MTKIVEFQIDSKAVVAKCKNRLISEFIILLSMVGLFVLVPVENAWIIWLLIGIFSLIFFFDLVDYWFVKKSAKPVSIILADNAIEFSSEKGIFHLPYNNMSIKKIKKRRGRISSIYLRTQFGPATKLEYFHQMDELYEALSTKLDQRGQNESPPG